MSYKFIYMGQPVVLDFAPGPEFQRKLAQIRSASPERFARLYDEYASRIYSFIYSRTADTQTAEDLTAQVFLKAWESIHHYRPSDAPMLAWLYTIARNAMIDDHRTRRETVALDDAGPLQSPIPTPAEECELAFESDILRQALQGLTAEQQQVVVLKFIDGLTTEEIAAQLGKRSGAVRALQMRALKTLSKQIGDV